MGGAVAVTIRVDEETEYRMARWTNGLPWFIIHPGLYGKSTTHLHEYLSPWLDMRSDYEANKDTGDFKHPMTGSYHPYYALAPYDYGLVVIDFVTDSILSCQGYCSIDTLYEASIKMHLHNTFGVDFHEAAKVYSQMVLDRRLYRQKLTFGKEGGVDIEKESLVREKDLPSLLKNKMPRDVFRYRYRVDLSPFNVFVYEDHGSEPLREMRAKLLELGFRLTSEDESRWQEAIRSQEEPEQEEEDGS